jgi:hypothetical protein
MSALVPFLTVVQPGDQVQSWIHQELTSAGFRVVQTFDLQVARLAQSDCTCPHHGTADCDCQLVVLLVYLEQEEPSTVVIHSRDGNTEVSLGGPLSQRVDLHAEQLLEGLIRAGVPRKSAPREPDGDVRSPGRLASL